MTLLAWIMLLQSRISDLILAVFTLSSVALAFCRELQACYNLDICSNRNYGQERMVPQ